MNRPNGHGINLPPVTAVPACYMDLFGEPKAMVVARRRPSIKTLALVDGKGTPMVLLAAPGQGGNVPMRAP